MILLEIKIVTMSIIVGGIAGWIAGQIMNGTGYGILRNIVLGIFGGWAGAWVFDMLDISAGNTTVGTLVTSVAGAVVLVFLYRLILGKR